MSELRGLTNIHASRLEASGGLSIIGTIRKLGFNYTKASIILINKKKKVIDSVTPNSDGGYKFDGLKKDNYCVAAFDTTKQFNAVIQDNVVPK